MEISKIIPKIRFKLDDTNESRYSDYQIMEALNEGHRFFRKYCVDNAPDLIAKYYEGVISAGSNIAYVSDMPIKITEMRINGYKIHPTMSSSIINTKDKGVPKEYVARIMGDNIKLLVYPVPQEDTEYSIQYIDSVEELTVDDELQYPMECISYLVDFVVTRLANTEPQSFTELEGKLKSILSGITPAPCVVDSYY